MTNKAKEFFENYFDFLEKFTSYLQQITFSLFEQRKILRKLIVLSYFSDFEENSFEKDFSEKELNLGLYRISCHQIINSLANFFNIVSKFFISFKDFEDLFKIDVKTMEKLISELRTILENTNKILLEFEKESFFLWDVDKAIVKNVSEFLIFKNKINDFLDDIVVKVIKREKEIKPL